MLNQKRTKHLFTQKYVFNKSDRDINWVYPLMIKAKLPVYECEIFQYNPWMSSFLKIKLVNSLLNIFAIMLYS